MCTEQNSRFMTHKMFTDVDADRSALHIFFFSCFKCFYFFFSLVDESNLKSITAFNSTGGVEIVELCATLGLLLVPRDVGTHGSLLI